MIMKASEAYFQEIQRAIERLTHIMSVFARKGGKDVDEVFDEMFKGDDGPD